MPVVWVLPVGLLRGKWISLWFSRPWNWRGDWPDFWRSSLQIGCCSSIWVWGSNQSLVLVRAEQTNWPSQSPSPVDATVELYGRSDLVQRGARGDMLQHSRGYSECFLIEWGVWPRKTFQVVENAVHDCVISRRVFLGRLLSQVDSDHPGQCRDVSCGWDTVVGSKKFQPRCRHSCYWKYRQVPPILWDRLEYRELRSRRRSEDTDPAELSTDHYVSPICKLKNRFGLYVLKSIVIEPDKDRPWRVSPYVIMSLVLLRERIYRNRPDVF